MALQSLVFIHILLLVFWLGTDLGVFVLARMAVNPAYAPGERAICLKAAMRLDIPPRICMVLILPTGVTLAAQFGIIDLAPGMMSATWIFALVWLAVVIAALARPSAPLGRLAKIIERGILFALAVTLPLTAILSQTTSLAPMPGWLALKLAAFGLIAAFGHMIDHEFSPAIGAFQAIMAEGSTTEREGAFRRAVNRSCFWVLVVYAMVMVAAFLGTVKP